MGKPDAQKFNIDAYEIFRELKTIPERFGNFIKLAANNWRLNNKRTLTVPELNRWLNLKDQKYFEHFAVCPN